MLLTSKNTGRKGKRKTQISLLNIDTQPLINWLANEIKQDIKKKNPKGHVVVGSIAGRKTGFTLENVSVKCAP